MIAAGYGIERVSREIGQSLPATKVVGIVSTLAACLVALVGVFYIWIGLLSLQVYLRM